MVPERYMDIITCEFAYDPVRLPLDQDPTQSLYNRKTLESIWETKRHVENPFTKQWFNAKSAIPQTELREEMEDYVKFQKLRSADLDVIEEYAKILGEGDMKRYLDILGECMSENVTTKMQCWEMWKKMNLLRMYCQFHSKNTETFRSLHGFRYFNELIIKIRILLRSNSIENDAKETLWDVCREMVRAMDVIGLEAGDINDIVDKTRISLLIVGYMRFIELLYLFTENYMKMESLVLRIFCKILDEMNVQAPQFLGIIVGSSIATTRLFKTDAKDISSEDLYHTISILRRSWIATSSFVIPLHHSHMLVNAIIICMARETDTSEDMRGCHSEEQLVEVEAEAQHNSKALELGLSLVKDILMTGGPFADNIHWRGVDIVDGIIRILRHFAPQGENEDETTGPAVCVCTSGACSIFQCIHSRIAQLGWDINKEQIDTISEEQLVEVEAEGQHNSKALELGLSLVKDILMTGGPFADNIHWRGVDIVDGIIRILRHFAPQGENEDETTGPAVCVCTSGACSIFGWDINTTLSNMGEPSSHNEVLP